MFGDVAGGVVLADALAAIDPAGVDDWDLVDVMRGWERLARWVEAGQLSAIAELARRRPRQQAESGPGHADRGDSRAPEVSEFAVDEVAAALGLSRPAAGVRLQVATELAGRLSGTASALRDGALDTRRARAIVDAVAPLDDSLAVAVQDRVLPAAGRQTVGQLRAALARAVLAVDPAAAEVRHQRAVAEREVTVRPLPDGMAGLWALLPADGAAALYGRIDELARGCRSDDPRGMDARRADALVSLALRPTPPTSAGALPAALSAGAGADRVSPRGVMGEVRPNGAAGHGAATQTTAGLAPHVVLRVTVPAATVVGLADEPGELAGHGPIPASMARRLAAGASWRRVRTDPATGVVTEVGRSGYTPSAALADLVRTRDRTCRFPGCRQPAHRCDLDHVVLWPSGPTAADNLTTLCRHHHRLKHQTTWQVEAGAAAELSWTSPAGHRYTTHPLGP